MEKAMFDGVRLEFEVKGSGEPVLLISPVVAGAFLPFMTAPTLVDRYQLIRYHKRGWCGSTRTAPPVSIEEHSADAAGLLKYLGLSRAHVAGHSSGAAVAMQLAVDRPDLVHTLALLEPTLFVVPGAATLFEKVGPSLAAYAAGDHTQAVTGFLSVVSGLDTDACQAVIERNVPGGIAQAIKDADTFFGIELPSLSAWRFAAEQARRIRQPVLSILGSNTGQLWLEVDALLNSWVAQVEGLTINGVGHLLQMQDPEPVARGLAIFLAHHPMTQIGLQPGGSQSGTAQQELVAQLREG
jgi:pimeloyl-ACP methyl ester carboxylesterase